MNDADPFDMVMRQLAGKRLTWKELIGKPQDVTTQTN